MSPRSRSTAPSTSCRPREPRRPGRAGPGRRGRRSALDSVPPSGTRAGAKTSQRWADEPSLDRALRSHRSTAHVAILPSLRGPAAPRRLTDGQLAALAAEIRETIIGTVARTGGHLGSSLGVVELTIALHRILDSPPDRIVWDTGHQTYPHKLLTGRYESFGTLRQLNGMGGFPRRSESEHDIF